MTSNSLKLCFILPPLSLAIIYSFKISILNSLFYYFYGRVVRESTEHASTASKWFYDERDCAFILALVLGASVISFNFGMLMGGYLFDTATRVKTQKSLIAKKDTLIDLAGFNFKIKSIPINKSPTPAETPPPSSRASFDHGSSDSNNINPNLKLTAKNLLDKCLERRKISTKKFAKQIGIKLNANKTLPESNRLTIQTAKDAFDKLTSEAIQFDTSQWKSVFSNSASKFWMKKSADICVQGSFSAGSTQPDGSFVISIGFSGCYICDCCCDCFFCLPCLRLLFLFAFSVCFFCCLLSLFAVC